MSHDNKDICLQRFELSNFIRHHSTWHDDYLNLSKSRRGYLFNLKYMLNIEKQNFGKCLYKCL